jgi:hypothetical protein
MTPSLIPTIDLARDSPERQAELIRHALGTVGFFAVQNAGPTIQDVSTMFAHVCRLASPPHSLPPTRLASHRYKHEATADCVPVKGILRPRHERKGRIPRRPLRIGVYQAPLPGARRRQEGSQGVGRWVTVGYTPLHFPTLTIRTFSYGKYCATTTQPLPPPFKDSDEAAAAIKRFYRACHDVSERLMELFALALEVSRGDAYRPGRVPGHRRY